MTERDLRYELNAEIERSKALVSKPPRIQPPGSASKGYPRAHGILGGDDPKIAAVTQFYEDLTNLLIPNVKFEPGKYMNLDEKTFTCVYSFANLDDTDDMREKSESFHK